MKPAIRIENLGKKYRVAHGKPRAGYRTLRESLVEAAAAPFRRLRHGFAAEDLSDDFWALQDVSFDVQPSEVVGIIGRNGAGKSTLLKILSQITKPSTGRVEINGRVGSLLEVGTGFHPELTGRENVFLNGSILGMSRREIDRKFDEIVAFAEVERFLETPVKRYSSGMYVRLAFAVAAHLDPEILIVDEVLSVGDAGFQQKCLEKMRECASGGRTVLLVSHHMGSVIDLCTSAVWLDCGRSRVTGSAASVIEEYLEHTTVSRRSAEWIDLGRVRRVGSGQARFRRAMYYGGVAGRAIHSDGTMSFCLEIESSEPASDVRVGVVIADRFGTSLVDINTIYIGKPIHLGEGRTRVEFTLDSLHLLPGIYRVTVALGSATDLFDSISNAFSFEVTPEPRSQFSGGAPIHGVVTREFHYRVELVEGSPELTSGLS